MTKFRTMLPARPFGPPTVVPLPIGGKLCGNGKSVPVGSDEYTMDASPLESTGDLHRGENEVILLEKGLLVECGLQVFGVAKIGD